MYAFLTFSDGFFHRRTHRALYNKDYVIIEVQTNCQQLLKIILHSHLLALNSSNLRIAFDTLKPKSHLTYLKYT